MKTARFLRLTGPLILLVSAAMPAWIAMRITGSFHPTAQPSGLAPLALPTECTSGHDPLRDWKAFPEVTASPPRLPPVEEPCPPDNPPVEDSCRIRVYGRVTEGSQRVYCFFDTKDNRWFRLPEGEKDPAAGILLVAGKDEAPSLLDLATGYRYRIGEGPQFDLIRVKTEVPLP
jgi:hypothetical protein